MYRKIKQYIFSVIQPAESGNIASKVFDLIIMLFIILSVSTVFIMTFDPPEQIQIWQQKIEIVSVVIFTVEYLLRIWTADLLYPESGFFGSRVKYMLSPLAMIDMMAILPFYLPMILPVDLISIRAVRLVRLLRMFKLNRYSEALSSIAKVFEHKAREIFASLFFVLILLIVASLLIYYAEHDAQPHQFQNAFSGLWWAVATLTTVGYGDIYPITPIGRVLGALIALLGIGMVAVPTSILSAGFLEGLEKENKGKEPEKKEEPAAESEKKYCPYCGKKLD